MLTDRRRLASTLGIVVASLSAGLLMGYWLRPDSQHVVPTNDNSALRQELLAAISALRADIDERFSQLDGQAHRGPADSTARSPVEPADSNGQDAQRLEAVLSRLEQFLASPSLPASMNSGPLADLTRELRAPGYPSLEVMRQQARNRLENPNDEGAARAVDQWRVTHGFWRADDVIVRYGRPDRIEWNGEYRLVYSGFDTNKETCDIFFKIDGQYVDEVSVECAVIR